MDLRCKFDQGEELGLVDGIGGDMTSAEVDEDIVGQDGGMCREACRTS